MTTALPAPAQAAPRTSIASPSGLAVTAWTDPAPPAAMPEAAAKLLHEAQELVQKNTADFAYPWYDRTTGTVRVDSTTGRGENLLAQFRGSHRVAATPVQGLRVTRSIAQLEQVKDEAIDPGAGVPDRDAIFMTEPDAESNRINVYVNRLSEPLLQALAKRFGTDSIAIRYMAETTSTGDARNNDTSPFYGGAKTSTPSTCTTGFSWRNGSANMMLTAGHCAPGGGDLSTPSSVIGYVTPNSSENWNNGTGTVYLSGQTTYRGDVALSSVVSGKATSPYIYRGGPGSSSGAAVGEMWSRAPVSGDKYCVGGHVTGEKCNWTVYSTGINFKHSDGATARNVVRSFYRNDGVCTIGGDSGGPVYTVRSDGKVAAKGIHHGHSSNSVSGCMQVFTDIWQAYYGLPGSLATA
ncbi:hypothetical protein [Micromonospora ureilytica]|uniref:hypothetical protein n=1 Tax=Micromonospora ureilytica TaxID=709868 RepID=UPI00403A3B01